MVYSSEIDGFLNSSSVIFYTPENFLFLEAYSKLGHKQEGKLYIWPLQSSI